MVMTLNGLKTPREKILGAFFLPSFFLPSLFFLEGLSSLPFYCFFGSTSLPNSLLSHCFLSLSTVSVGLILSFSHGV
jgi:hypothetical protein